MRTNLDCFVPFCFNLFEVKNTEPLLVLENVYHPSTFEKALGDVSITRIKVNV